MIGENHEEYIASKWMIVNLLKDGTTLTMEDKSRIIAALHLKEVNLKVSELFKY